MVFVESIGEIMKINIKTFNDWAIVDKDLDMQRGNEAPVDFMFNLVSEKNTHVASYMVDREKIDKTWVSSSNLSVGGVVGN